MHFCVSLKRELCGCHEQRNREFVCFISVFGWAARAGQGGRLGRAAFQILCCLLAVLLGWEILSLWGVNPLLSWLVAAGFFLLLKPSWALLYTAMAFASFVPSFFVVFDTLQAVNCQGTAQCALEFWGTNSQETLRSFKAPKPGEMRDVQRSAWCRTRCTLCKALSTKPSDPCSNCIQSNPVPCACCTRSYRCQEVLLRLQGRCVSSVTSMGLFYGNETAELCASRLR